MKSFLLFLAILGLSAAILRNAGKLPFEFPPPIGNSSPQASSQPSAPAYAQPAGELPVAVPAAGHPGATAGAAVAVAPVRLARIDSGRAVRAQWRRTDLVLLRGRVLGVMPEGLVVYCVPGPSAELLRPITSLPNGGRGVSQATQNQARKYDLIMFGDLMVCDRGMLRRTELVPSTAPLGLALLRNHPHQAEWSPGRHFRVVAAPTDERFLVETTDRRTSEVDAYTMQFTVVGEGGASWLYEPKSDSPLNRKGYR